MKKFREDKKHSQMGRGFMNMAYWMRLGRGYSFYMEESTTTMGFRIVRPV
jgi:hypothetical protein